MRHHSRSRAPRLGAGLFKQSEDIDLSLIGDPSPSRDSRFSLSGDPSPSRGSRLEALGLGAARLGAATAGGYAGTRAGIAAASKGYDLLGRHVTPKSIPFSGFAPLAAAPLGTAAGIAAGAGAAYGVASLLRKLRANAAGDYPEDVREDPPMGGFEGGDLVPATMGSYLGGISGLRANDYLSKLSPRSARFLRGPLPALGAAAGIAAGALTSRGLRRAMDRYDDIGSDE